MNLAAAVLARARLGYLPPPRLSVSAFADQEIILTSGPLAGAHWSTSFAPYQRGIMDVFDRDGIEFAVVMGSSQWGKTAIAVNLVAYHIAYDPCTILIVEPTVEPMAKDFAKNRLDPVIAASPILRAAVSKKRAKDSSNTILAKTFRGGALSVGGANSAASLASRPVRLLILDEVDRYPAELKGEGSTLAIAIKRTTTYQSRRRIFMPSSPTLEGGAIDSWFKRGDQRRYFVPCPSCGEFHTYQWANVKWIDRDPRTARLECPFCKFKMDDAARLEGLPRGEWRPTAETPHDPRVASFHLWEAYSPMSSLSEIVAGFLAARERQKAGDPAEMHTWENTTLGEPRAPDRGDGIDQHALMARREAYAAEVPAGVCLITAGIDVQDDRLEALVLGWGPGEECWLIDRATFPGDTSQPEPWAALDELFDRPYLRAEDPALTVRGACIDSAGHRTTMVYDYAKRMAARNVFAIIGRDGQRPIVSSPSPRRWGRGNREIPLYTVGVDAAKAIWTARLKKPDQGPGFVHLPAVDWADEELAAQLTSEVLVTKWSKGLPEQVWKKLRPRNEALDMAVYGLAALRLLHPNLDVIAAQLAAASARSGAPLVPPPAAPARPRWIPPRPGWLRG